MHPDEHPSPEWSVTFAPNASAHVRTDGTVAVMSNKSEMGQAMFTKGVDFIAVDSVAPEMYAFANTRTAYGEFEPGVPVGSMRAPGPSWNTFVTESFIDELAHAGEGSARVPPCADVAESDP